jgi:RNA polymerase sigma factor (sigma-70 family)
MHGKHVVHLERCSEADLVEAAKAGDDDALERLFISYPPIRRIVRSLSRQYDPNGRASEELEAAARLGLVEALGRFQPARGVKFTTFAFNFVRGAMLKALYSRTQRREWAAGQRAVTFVPFGPESEDQNFSADDPEAELARRDDQYGIETGYTKVERRPTEQAVRDFVAELPANQRGIVRDVFWNGTSHAEAAQRRGVSRPAVSRTLQRVYKRGERELVGHLEALAA